MAESDVGRKVKRLAFLTSTLKLQLNHASLDFQVHGKKIGSSYREANSFGIGGTVQSQKAIPTMSSNQEQLHTSCFLVKWFLTESETFENGTRSSGSRISGSDLCKQV